MRSIICTRRMTAFFILTVQIFSAGCESSLEPVFVVQGTLLVGGEPAANAAVAFHPAQTANKPHRGICAVAKTDANGAYRLSTFSSGDGALPGDYIVTVIWLDDSIPFDECDCDDPTKHDRLRGAYANPQKSPLRATVQSRSNDIALIASIHSSEPPTEREAVRRQIHRRKQKREMPFLN